MFSPFNQSIIKRRSFGETKLQFHPPMTHTREASAMRSAAATVSLRRTISAARKMSRQRQRLLDDLRQLFKFHREREVHYITNNLLMNLSKLRNGKMGRELTKGQKK